MFSLKKFSLNKEWNITIKPIVSVWFIHFSRKFLSYIYKQQKKFMNLNMN